MMLVPRFPKSIWRRFDTHTAVLHVVVLGIRERQTKSLLHESESSGMLFTGEGGPHTIL